MNEFFHLVFFVFPFFIPSSSAKGSIGAVVYRKTSSAWIRIMRTALELGGRESDPAGVICSFSPLFLPAFERSHQHLNGIQFQGM